MFAHRNVDVAVQASWRGVTDALPSSEMIELDGDEERISSQGRYAERDIVQVQNTPEDTADWLEGCSLSRKCGIYD